MDKIQNVLEWWNLCLISVLGTFTHILKVMRLWFFPVLAGEFCRNSVRLSCVLDVLLPQHPLFLARTSSIYSFCSMSYDRSVASSKPVFYRVRSSASSCNFQHPHVPFRSSNSCLRLPPSLPVTSILPSLFPAITCFRKQFLREMWPIRLAFLLYFILFAVYSSPWLGTTSFLTRFRFSHSRSNWSSCFSITTFQNFASISDLLSEMSKIQHRTKLCSKCSTLLASSLHLSHLLVKRAFFLFNAAFALAVLDLICQDLTSVINPYPTNVENRVSS